MRDGRLTDSRPDPDSAPETTENPGPFWVADNKPQAPRPHACELSIPRPEFLFPTSNPDLKSSHSAIILSLLSDLLQIPPYWIDARPRDIAPRFTLSSSRIILFHTSSHGIPFSVHFDLFSPPRGSLSLLPTAMLHRSMLLWLGVYPPCHLRPMPAMSGCHSRVLRGDFRLLHHLPNLTP